MAQLEVLFDKIEVLEGYFKKYSNRLRGKTLQEIKEKIKGKQTYKIAIVANMSAGKSTLINALFGREILPSFNEATSDCIVEITSMPKIPKKAEVFFENKSPITLEEKDFKELKQYAQKDSKCDEKYQKVEKITLSYPFLHIPNKQESKQKNIEILFIDTPGPNNTEDDFAYKHANQTKTALNDVDMALFTFDYGQLDANLRSDAQGLWHTIRERKEKDENFEVFFLLNKIDMALSDNNQEMKNDPTYSRENEIELTKKYWNKHEEEAIAKLKKAAKDHGIQDPKIFALSSYYELLRRMDNDERLSGDEEDKLENFTKKFRRMFGEKYEEKLIDYTGFEKLENAMNDYIDKQVLDKIFEKNFRNIKAVLSEEIQAIERSIQNSQKPKEEAEQNIKDAREFLQKELPQIQEETEKEIVKNREETKKKVKSTIEKWIKQEFTDKVEELVLKTVIFMHEFAEGNKNLARRVEEILKSDALEKQNYLKTTTLSVKEKEMQVSIHSETSKYLHSLIEGCKNNFLDIRSEIKNHYESLNKQCNQSLQDFKSKIGERLNSALQIEMSEQMQSIAIDYSDALNFSTRIPASVLSYSHQKAQYREVSTASWWNPFSWFSTKDEKVSDEKYNITINPKELQEAIKNTFKSGTEDFKTKEIEQHQEAITAFGNETLQKAIQNITENRRQEIERLDKNIQDEEHNLEELTKQKEELTKIQREMEEA